MLIQTNKIPPKIILNDTIQYKQTHTQREMICKET